MNRITHFVFAGLMALISLAFTGCDGKKTSPVTQASGNGSPRVALMPESSGEVQRVYTDQPDGTVKVDIAFIDGSTGTMTGRADASGKFTIQSGSEHLADGTNVIYGYRAGLDEPAITSYFRANGTLYIIREVLDESVTYRVFAEDGKTVIRTAAQSAGGHNAVKVYFPDGKTVMVAIETWKGKSSRISVFNDKGQPEFAEYSDFGNGPDTASIDIQWYQNGIKRVSEKWRGDGEGEVPVLFESFNDAGKTMLRVTPAPEFADARVIQKWTATQFDDKTNSSSTTEVGDLEFVGYPEGEVREATEGARHILEEYSPFMLDALDHASSFEQF